MKKLLFFVSLCLALTGCSSEDPVSDIQEPQKPEPQKPELQFADFKLPSGTLWSKTNLGADSELSPGYYCLHTNSSNMFLNSFDIFFVPKRSSSWFLADCVYSFHFSTSSEKHSQSVRKSSFVRFFISRFLSMNGKRSTTV